MLGFRAMLVVLQVRMGWNSFAGTRAGEVAVVGGALVYVLFSFQEPCQVQVLGETVSEGGRREVKRYVCEREWMRGERRKRGTGKEFQQGKNGCCSWAGCTYTIHLNRAWCDKAVLQDSSQIVRGKGSLTPAVRVLAVFFLCTA